MKKMSLLIVFLSFVFIFLMAFGGTILKKLAEDYRAVKKDIYR